MKPEPYTWYSFYVSLIDDQENWSGEAGYIQVPLVRAGPSDKKPEADKNKTVPKPMVVVTKPKMTASTPKSTPYIPKKKCKRFACIILFL